VASLGGGILSFAAGSFGVWAAVEGRMLLGTGAALFFLWAMYTTVLWQRDVGKTVLRFSTSGLAYYDHFLPWDQILNVEIIRRHERYYIVLSVAGGKAITIRDDYLDRSMNDIFLEIGRRIEGST
jgi:hypothetical protein